MTFKELSEYFQKIEENPSRLKMTAILADLFKESRKEEIAKICYLSLGRLLPSYSGLEFQMAQKMMEKAISKAFSVDLEKVKKLMGKLGDLGKAGEALKSQISNIKYQRLFEESEEKGEMGVLEVYERLFEIAKENGEGSVERKVDKMALLLQQLDSLSVRFVIRMPLEKMRLGFSEMTILDSLSWMLKGDKSLREELEDAYNLVADIGEIAERIREVGEVRGVRNIKPKLGTPIIPALCQRLGTAEEIIEKLGEVAVEPKYDGTRLQIHYRKIKNSHFAKATRDKQTSKIKNNEVQIFTRNMENVTHMFPDLAGAIEKEIKAESAIFDGEGVGVDPKTNKFLPFQETIKRKRKHGIEQTSKDIPINYYVFDILYKDGKDLIKVPFNERRGILEKTVDEKGIIKLSPQIITSDPEELRKYHEKQISLGLEGVVTKNWQSFYEPGRKGFHWVKLKQEETKKGAGLSDTIDCVIMGIYVGEGKRTDFGVGAFLVGIKDKEKFLTISKIGTGLTDEQFKELKTKSSKLKVKEKPKNYVVDSNMTPDFWLEPKLVAEIQADNITLSPIHSAKMALRFPRLVRFRDDKSVEQTTSLKEVRDIYNLQYGVETKKNK